MWSLEIFQLLVNKHINIQNIMKKIILSLVLLFCMCIGAFAQTKVSFYGPIGLDWKFKRSFLNGNTLVVDFIVENNTSKDVTCRVTGSGYNRSKKDYDLTPTAYDDEGNVYDWPHRQISGKMGSQNIVDGSDVTIPPSNLMKLRIQIADIDEFATLIKTLVLPVCFAGVIAEEKFAELRVTNIPIPRE